MKKGILLINLGTPDNVDAISVRRYLKEFLNDPKVIDLPGIIRWFLVNLIVIPRRYQASQRAYQKIWTSKGSPLLVNSLLMSQGLSQALGNDYKIVLGMRYGNPSLKSAVEQLKDCDEIIILPLFPQYAEASTGSAIQKSLYEIKEVVNTTKGLNLKNTPIRVIEDFYNHPGFIKAYAEIIQKHGLNISTINTEQSATTKIIFSYHGLPERHLREYSCYKKCSYYINNKAKPHACDYYKPQNKTQGNRCYRSQCYETSRLLAETLGLSEQQYCVSFQSRLGKTPWIKPYTDLLLPELAKEGIRDIIMVSPSFVADCLETLEEIDIRTREQWQLLGGRSFITVPCLNGAESWIKGLVKIVEE